MGLFDTIHGGARCGQVKCLGKSLGNYVVGDGVRLVPAPMDQDEYDEYLSGRAVVRPEADFQLAMGEGGFLLVRDGVLVAWQAERDTDLPLFDTLGRPLASVPDGYGWPQVEEDCGVCAVVLADGPQAARAMLEARRAERAAEPGAASASLDDPGWEASS